MAKKKKKKEKRSVKIALQFLAMIAFVFLLLSCLSFDIGDWPSSYVYPHNEPVENWCGVGGSFLAYYMLYYVGPGVFILLISGIVFAAAKIKGAEIGQMFLRSTGLILLTVAASASFYCLWPDAVFKFPSGSGGMLGVATAQFLNDQFNLLGTFLLILATWLVGVVLLADTLIISFLASLSHGLLKFFGFAGPAIGAAKKHSDALGKIWQKLSIKEKQEKEKSLAFDKDAHIEKTIEYVREEPEEEQQKQQKQEKKPLKIRRKKKKKKKVKVTEQKPSAPKKKYVPKSYEDYQLPPLELLEEPEENYEENQNQMVKEKASILERLLKEFNVDAQVVAADTGPVVTMYELELAAGVKVSQISSLSNDIARALGAGAVRVVAPLPGKHTIGIEVPNSRKEKVRLKDLLQMSGDKSNKMSLPLFLGKDSSGEALVSDLAAMPHVLIAGTTGSGKSVCINSIINSMLMLRRPDEVKMILIDPKMVEMSMYNNVPHLMCPIVTETQRAVQILEWATVKMDERYALLAEARVRNIAGYNKLSREEIIDRFNPTTPDEEAKIPKKLPHIVIVIDELADLMMTAAKEIESYIVRLAQKSRAVGINIVLATQRPQATVVTGLIKSNMPCRIGFRVAARMDSRIILDQNGAETLLGQGDMLFLKPGTSDLVRAQGTFVDDNEIRAVVKHLKEIAEPQFHPELQQLGKVDPSALPKDDLFDDAVEIVLETQRGSVSLLQRRLSIGYARASRIIESMANSGILGEYKGSQAREVLMTKDEWENLQKSMRADKAAGFTDMQDDEDEEEGVVSEGQREYMALEDEEDEDYEYEDEDEQEYEYVEED